VKAEITSMFYKYVIGNEKVCLDSVGHASRKCHLPQMNRG